MHTHGHTPACNLCKVTTDEAQFTAGEKHNAWIVVNLKRVSLWGLYKEKGARSFWGQKNINWRCLSLQSDCIYALYIYSNFSPRGLKLEDI